MDMSPHVMLGGVYMDQGRYEEAAEVTRKAFDLCPTICIPTYAQY